MGFYRSTNWGEFSQEFSHYSLSHIDRVDFSNLPCEVSVFFNQRMNSFPHVGLFSRKYLHTFCVHDPDDAAVSYAGLMRTSYSNAPLEDILHIYQTSSCGERVGCSQINYAFSFEPHVEEKPFVGFTQTESTDEVDFRSQGFGKKRLLLMNAFSHALWNSPLHSDTQHDHVHATATWESLVRRKLAKQYFEDETPRYVMTAKPYYFMK